MPYVSFITAFGADHVLPVFTALPCGVIFKAVTLHAALDVDVSFLNICWRDAETESKQSLAWLLCMKVSFIVGEFKDAVYFISNPSIFGEYFIEYFSFILVVCVFL